MAKLPDRNVLNGNKTPRTTTGEMKEALGKLRDYLGELLGDDSNDKEAARLALGIDLAELTGKIDAKADLQEIETAILSKADRTELNDKAQELEEAIAKRGTPVGSIEYFAMATPPAGYLKADGATVGRQTYPELFDAIGTIFGEGDGETTFNLPNLIGRFAQGSSMPGVKMEAGLPNIEGTVDINAVIPDASGVFTRSARSTHADGATAPGWQVSLDASRSNPVFGASDTVQPPALTLLPCIKAFDAATHPGMIDMSALANDVAHLSADKLDKTVNGNAVRYIADAYNDGTNWYRKWSDGWIEQGGVVDTGSYVLSKHIDISFPVPFADNAYTALCSKNDVNDQANSRSVDMIVHSKTTASMAIDFYSAGATTRYVGWMASGHNI